MGLMLDSTNASAWELGEIGTLSVSPLPASV